MKNKNHLSKKVMLTDKHRIFLVTEELGKRAKYLLLFAEYAVCMNETT